MYRTRKNVTDKLFEESSQKCEHIVINVTIIHHLIKHMYYEHLYVI